MEQNKTAVVVVGGGASTSKFLTALKKAGDIKDQIGLTVIDGRDYIEAPVATQRFLVHAEKAQFGTVSYTDVFAVLGFGRHVHGYVSYISKKNKVCIFCLAVRFLNVLSLLRT